MNFFQSQDKARTNTKKLVLLFALAVISLILLTNVFLVAIFTYLEGSVLTMQSFSERFNWDTFLLVGAGITTVIIITSLYKIISLSGGGSKVMSYMNAELVIHDTGDAGKQKILNVVEEMAIASGTPVPPVYLLDEPGINAFAAGLSIRDAAIGITRGAINNLTRDQLQGVIAHEFSHILNGDMRLNLRLIGILHGIMIIGLIGRFFMYSGSHRSNSKNNNMLIGLGLMVIGYAGTFFGNWIKAAVSRQREYLADASAVQFTRNPDGIAGALIKIGGYDYGSQLQNPQGSEISHALFSEGVTVYFKSLFATHPPLAVRIKKILPDWNGEFDLSDTVKHDAKFTNDSSNEELGNHAQYAPFSGDAGGVVISSLLTEEIINSVGQTKYENLQQAQKLILDLPPALYQSTHEPHGARAVMYFLLLNKDADIRQKQLQYCSEHTDAGVYPELQKFESSIAEINTKYRLAIIDIALPALRQLSVQQVSQFKKNFIALARMDSKISLFEWAIQKIIFTALDINNKRQKLGHKQYSSLQQLKDECSIVLSVLIHTDADTGTYSVSVDTVFSKVTSSLECDIRLLARSEIDLRKLEVAIEKLKHLKPLIKPQFLKACVLAINTDNKITARQLELFRAFSDILDCPMPLLENY